MTPKNAHCARPQYIFSTPSQKNYAGYNMQARRASRSSVSPCCKLRINSEQTPNRLPLSPQKRLFTIQNCLYLIANQTDKFNASMKQGHVHTRDLVRQYLSGIFHSPITIIRTFAIAVLLAITATTVQGQMSLTVNDGTSTSSYIPMYGGWFDDFTKSECIYPYTLLVDMPAGSIITSMTFYPRNFTTGNGWGGTNQKVFLKEVASTSLGGSYSGMDGATVVFDGQLPLPSGSDPYTIDFSTNYTYNGGNLLIGVYNDDDGNYNFAYWYGTTGNTTGASAYGSHSSSLASVSYTQTNFLPKVTFTYLINDCEDFESGSMPAGWTTSGPGTWTVGTGDYTTGTGAHGGTYNAKITHGTTNNETYLISPVMDFSNASSLNLSFWLVNRSWAGDIDELGVYYRVNGGAWTEIFYTTATHAVWSEQIIELPGLAANYQIAFKMKDKYGYGVGIDDVCIFTPEPVESNGCESFEGGSIPSGWTTSGAGSWNVGTGDYSTATGAQDGSYNARITHGTSGAETYLISPVMDFSSARSATLSFWYVNRSWGGDIDELGVYYRVNGGAWTELFSTSTAHSTWTEQIVELTGLDANYQFAFKFTDHYGYGVGIDYVCITSEEACTGFEDGSMPSGWTTSGPGTWTVGTGDYYPSTGAHDGSYNALITHSSTGNETYLISPMMDFSAASSATLSFWYINKSWGGDIDYLTLYYRIGASGVWVQIGDNITAAHSSWTEMTIDLPAGALAANCQIGFKHTDKYGYGVGIDDVCIFVSDGNVTPTTCDETIVLNQDLTQIIECGTAYCFYDSGGESGSYSDNEYYTATFIAAGDITITFSDYNTESYYDYLYIYDGTIDGTQLFNGYGVSSLPSPLTATSGVMTVVWNSDGSNTYGGWKARITGPDCCTPARTLSITDCPTGSVYHGSSFTLHAQASAGGGTVTWQSGNEAVATVDNSGNVTCVGVGTVSIMAFISASDPYCRAVATCDITVSCSDGAWNIDDIHRQTKTIECGKSYCFYDSGGPDNIYENNNESFNCSFTSSGYVHIKFMDFYTENPDVLTISGTDNDGAYSYSDITPGTEFVCSTEGGTIDISWSSDGSVQYAGWKAVITAEECCTHRDGAVQITNSCPIELTYGNTVQLNGSVTVGGGDISWQSSNPDVATVSASGLVSALNIGTTTITYTCADDGIYCAENTTCVVDIVVPTPTITQTDDPLPACGNGSATLVANVSGVPAGYEFHWYTNSSCTTEITTGVSGPNNNTLSYNNATNGTQVYCRLESHTANNEVVTDFLYTGAVQTYTVPIGAVEVKMEVWGAQGGSGGPSYPGAKGGYSVGTMTLHGVSTLYVYVGGEGRGNKTSNSVTTNQSLEGGFNGGGASYQTTESYIRGSGGGATDIRVGGNSLYNRVIVAGGGGGSFVYTSSGIIGGVGGGANGGNGIGNTGTQNGGTQTSGGTSSSTSNPGPGTFGQGGSYNPNGLGSGIPAWHCGGGGGWYGGSAGTPGGGGSGYIYTAETSANYPSGCLLNSDNYLSDAQTISGDLSMPDPSNGTMIGREGDGFARITAISHDGTNVGNAGSITIQCCGLEATIDFED